ncbi:MAG: hypothetical protein JF606_09885 [Burkholderiales bacterium]|jgi:flagellar biosynthesis chaperone FliJ|nr:hypothetical protein [Burkholderiales bacterium]
MSATSSKALILEVAQLLRLRKLRAEAARIERETARAKRDAAQQAVLEREAQVQRLRVERNALGESVVAIAPAMALLAPFASARREVLDDALERAEYALIDDEEVLTQAQSAFDEAHAAWQKAVARCDAVEKLHETTRRDATLAAEERAEREVDVSPRSVMLEGTP